MSKIEHPKPGQYQFVDGDTVRLAFAMAMAAATSQVPSPESGEAVLLAARCANPSLPAFTPVDLGCLMRASSSLQ